MSVMVTKAPASTRLTDFITLCLTFVDNLAELDKHRLFRSGRGIEPCRSLGRWDVTRNQNCYYKNDERRRNQALCRYGPSPAPDLRNCGLRIAGCGSLSFAIPQPGRTSTPFDCAPNIASQARRGDGHGQGAHSAPYNPVLGQELGGECAHSDRWRSTLECSSGVASPSS